MTEIPTLIPASKLREDYRNPPNPKDTWNKVSATAWKNHAAWWLHKARKVQKDLEEGTIKISEDNRQGLEDYFSKIVAEVHELQSVLRSFNPKKVLRAVESTDNLQTLVESCENQWRASKQVAERRASGISSWSEPPKDSGMEAFKKCIKSSARFRAHGVPQAALFQRRDTFLAISSWMDQCYFQGAYGNKRILWLRDAEGQAACGKSVVTHFVAKKCLQLEEFSAGYVFEESDRGAVSARELRTHFIATLAADLAVRLDYGSVVTALNEACNAHCSPGCPEFFDWALSDQFQTILLPALSSLLKNERQPLLIILDDIHKCDSRASEELFQMMSISLSSRLPIHFLVSARATAWVTKWLDAGAGQGLTDFVRALEVQPFIPSEKVSDDTQSHSVTQPVAEEDSCPTPTALAAMSLESLALSEGYEKDFDPTATVASGFSDWNSLHLGPSLEAVNELPAEAEAVLEVPDPSKLTDQERSEATTYLNAVDNVASGLLRFLRGKPSSSKR